ncbi:MAG TPA: IS481 family transposase [Thermoanaerobaculia bacterium]|jgi:transposase InsO family protein|nr:IS481 family transposase [Thermoanaerobaculia bacterium]
MNVHKNARSCAASRELLVSRVMVEGWSIRKAAEAIGLSGRRASHWIGRARTGDAGWQYDRSSRPHQLRGSLSEQTRRQIVAYRNERLTMAEIAAKVGCSQSSVSRVLAVAGLSRLTALEPPVPLIRYERDRPGELLHLDIKRFGKIDGIGHRITGVRTHRPRPGYECLHVAVDDHSRVTYAEVLVDQSAETAAAFLERAVAKFHEYGVTIERVLTDNGGCYRSQAFAAACANTGIKHKRTRPYTPRTNGKAERMIQTLLREWAYRRPYSTSDARTAALSPYLHRYNYHRLHRGIANRPPITRLAMNNLLRTDN